MNIELYIIGVTFFMIIYLWLYSLPFKLVGGTFRAIKGFIPNKKTLGIKR